MNNAVVTADQFVASIPVAYIGNLGILDREATRVRNRICKGVRLIDSASSRRNRKEVARLKAIVEPMRARFHQLTEAVCRATWAGKDERGYWQMRSAEETERVAAEEIVALGLLLTVAS